MMKLRQSFSVAVSYVLSVCNTVALSLLIHCNHCPQAPWTNTAKTAPTLPLCLVLFRELIQQSRARAVFLAQANFLSFLFCLLLCLHFDMPTETRHIWPWHLKHRLSTCYCNRMINYHHFPSQNFWVWQIFSPHNLFFLPPTKTPENTFSSPVLHWLIFSRPWKCSEAFWHAEWEWKRR